MPPKSPEAYRSLSPDELRRLWRMSSRTRGTDPPRVVEYDQVISAKSIDGLFGGKNAFILFYPAVESEGALMGHYVALVLGTHEGKKTIYFADSYGDLPDSQKENADPRLYRRERSNTLLKLFLDSGYDVDYNHHALQSSLVGVATCGRWALWRCENADLTNDQFAQLAKFGASRLKQTLDDTAVAYWP